MIKVIYDTRSVASKDLEMQFNISNLLIGKNIIWYKFSALKRETSKQTANLLYNKN